MTTPAVLTPQPPTPRRLVRELPRCSQPAYRLAEVGAEALSVVELLALLLGTPDALDHAAEVLARIGPERLLSATAAEFAQLRGIGRRRAQQLVAALALGRKLIAQATPARVQLKSPADSAAYLMPQVVGREAERLAVVLLNTKNEVLDTIWLYQGTLNSAAVRVAEVFREAIRRPTAAIIVAHSHPSGDPTPSPEDIRITRELRQAGELLGIELLDHLILGTQRFTSMKERGLGF